MGDKEGNQPLFCSKLIPQLLQPFLQDMFLSLQILSVFPLDTLASSQPLLLQGLLRPSNVCRKARWTVLSSTLTAALSLTPGKAAIFLRNHQMRVKLVMLSCQSSSCVCE
jgi:hypothetical protein